MLIGVFLPILPETNSGRFAFRSRNAGVFLRIVLFPRCGTGTFWRFFTPPQGVGDNAETKPAPKRPETTSEQDPARSADGREKTNPPQSVQKQRWNQTRRKAPRAVGERRRRPRKDQNRPEASRNNVGTRPGAKRREPSAKDDGGRATKPKPPRSVTVCPYQTAAPSVY